MHLPGPVIDMNLIGCGGVAPLLPPQERHRAGKSVLTALVCLLGISSLPVFLLISMWLAIFWQFNHRVISGILRDILGHSFLHRYFPSFLSQGLPTFLIPSHLPTPTVNQFLVQLGFATFHGHARLTTVPIIAFVPSVQMEAQWQMWKTSWFHGENSFDFAEPLKISWGSPRSSQIFHWESLA